MNKRKHRLAVTALALLLLCGFLTGCSAQNITERQEQENSVEAQQAPAAVRIGSLKGPTSMGLLSLMEKAEAGETENRYEFRMAVGADELLPLMVKGELDIVLIPANVAAMLYHKTDGGVAVIDINTLGVLYMVTGDSSIQSVADLKGRTIYLTGKGTTPDYVLHYILAGNELSEDKYQLEYRSEASEIAAILAEKPEAVGLLPQPFAAAACAKNDKLSAVLEMDEEWNRLQGEGGSHLVTGVTIVRKEFLEEHEENVKSFLKEHKDSAEAINRNPEEGAKQAVAAGIVGNEETALAAIPECNITCLIGEEMKQALSGYLEVLYGMDPESVGGVLPGQDFYYMESVTEE